MAFPWQWSHGRCFSQRPFDQRGCWQVHCSADTVLTVASSPAVNVQQQYSHQRAVAPAVSQLPMLQLAVVDTDLQQAVQVQQTQELLRVPTQRLQQQQQAVLSSLSSSAADGSSDVNTTGSTAPHTKQHRKRHKQKRKQQQLPQSSAQQQQQQQQVQEQQAPCRTPIKYPACGKADGVQLAGSISRRLRKGQQVLVPAGGGMQLVRSTAMLASARALLLSSGSGTELVFQPSLSVKAAPAGAHRQAQQQRQQQQQLVDSNSAGSSMSDRASSSMEASTSGRDRPAASDSRSSSKGAMLLVSAAPEAQLCRFDPQPLIAARSTPAASLAAAMFARLCNKGFMSVRAAGPEATRLAVLAVAEARRKALGCGLDLAVVPATDYVDVEALPGPEGVSRFREADLAEGGVAAVGPGEELPKQFVRVTVLHVVRCQPQQPWRLLPRPVPQQQRPDVRMADEQTQQPQQQWQGQSAVAAQHEQQQQQHLGRELAVAAEAFSKPQDPQQQPTNGEQQQEQQQPAVAFARLRCMDQGSGLSNSAVPISWLNGSLQAAVLGAEAAGRHAEASALVVSSASTAGSAWGGAAASATPDSAADALLAPEQLGLLQLQHDDAEASEAAATPGHGSSSSSCSSVAARQPGALLLQHKQANRKGSRQLVAAAQAPASSSSSSAASANHS